MRKAVLIILFAHQLKAFAQTEEKGFTADTANTSLAQMEEVTVTATRTRSTGLLTPYSLNKITSSDLERFQYRTAPEALTGLAGVFVQKTNHGGGSPFVRGLTGNQVLIMVDGIRINNATFRYGPNQYMNTIDAYTIDKVEIARGTGSVQYGSDAMGGVVQVFTKEPDFSEKPNWKVVATGKVASQDMEYSARGSVQYQSQQVAITAGYTRRRFGDLYGGDTTGKQTPSGYGEQAVDAKLKWKLNDHAVLTLANTFLQQEDVPLFHRVKQENFHYYFSDPLRNQLSYATMVIEGKKQLLKKITFTASSQNRSEVRNYQKNNATNRYLEKDKVNTAGLTADFFSMANSNWTFNSGIEWYFDKVQSNKKEINIVSGSALQQRGLYPDNSTSSNYSVYSLHHFKRNKWVAEAGVRYNLFSISIPDLTTAPSIQGLKNVPVHFHPSSLVANAALLYRMDGRQSMYGSYSTGYRAPNIDDMGTLGLADFRYEVPASNLSPEKSYHSEIGYRFASPFLHISGAVFYMQMADIITRVKVEGSQVSGYQVYRKENSQKGFIKGAEFSLDWKVATHWRLWSGAAFAYGQNTSYNEPMRRVPPFNGRMMLDYSNNRWQWAVEQLFASTQTRLAQGDKDDNRIPPGGTPGWNLLNVYGSYGAGYLHVRAGVQNVFNEDYRTHGSGINGMGRSAWLAVQFELR